MTLSLMPAYSQLIPRNFLDRMISLQRDREDRSLSGIKNDLMSKSLSCLVPPSFVSSIDETLVDLRFINLPKYSIGLVGGVSRGIAQGILRCVKDQINVSYSSWSPDELLSSAMKHEKSIHNPLTSLLDRKKYLYYDLQLPHVILVDLRQEFLLSHVPRGEKHTYHWMTSLGRESYLCDYLAGLCHNIQLMTRAALSKKILLPSLWLIHLPISWHESYWKWLNHMMKSFQPYYRIEIVYPPYPHEQWICFRFRRPLSEDVMLFDHKQSILEEISDSIRRYTLSRVTLGGDRRQKLHGLLKTQHDTVIRRQQSNLEFLHYDGLDRWCQPDYVVPVVQLKKKLIIGKDKFGGRDKSRKRSVNKKKNRDKVRLSQFNSVDMSVIPY